MTEIVLGLNDGLSEEQISIKEEVYLEMLEKTPSLKKYEAGARSIPINNDIECFVDSVKELIDQNQFSTDVKVSLIDEYSYKNIFENPDKPGEDLAGVVVYSMEERTPGTTKGGNTPTSRQRREIVPQIRGWSVDEKDNPGQVVIHKAKWFDNMICFKMAARTNHMANKMALWFEDLMELNREFFASRGFVRYYFDRRGGDEYIKDGEAGIHMRPLIFYVRTERVYNVSEQIINRLVIGLSN